MSEGGVHFFWLFVQKAEQERARNVPDNSPVGFGICSMETGAGNAGQVVKIQACLP